MKLKSPESLMWLSWVTDPVSIRGEISTQVSWPSQGSSFHSIMTQTQIFSFVGGRIQLPFFALQNCLLFLLEWIRMDLSLGTEMAWVCSDYPQPFILLRAFRNLHCLLGFAQYPFLFISGALSGHSALGYLTLGSWWWPLGTGALDWGR